MVKESGPTKISSRKYEDVRDDLARLRDGKLVIAGSTVHATAEQLQQLDDVDALFDDDYAGMLVKWERISRCGQLNTETLLRSVGEYTSRDTGGIENPTEETLCNSCFDTDAVPYPATTEELMRALR